tara:strand:- start:12863 stop:13876 length:1014 start_codon:yes stop_codon:yes gene_type:complete
MNILKNKTLLITGGTGSFGNTVLDRFLKTDIQEIRIFSRDEKKQEDMRIHYNNSKLNFFIGDVRDKDSLELASNNVDFIFHAAALKQVPSCEFHPMEAFKTNVIGTENIIETAIKKNTKKLVLLSTDKAVYPINTMGISKAMAEKLLIAKSRLFQNNTILCATRYGNVMNSRGSVIPLFIQQIKNNLPITITDPMMTRFMMSLEESVNLVLYAFNKGQQGDIFVQKAPACKIGDLAEALKIIFNSNAEIKYIGTRHGEKLYESLLSREEVARSNDLGDYYSIPPDVRNLNYSSYFTDGDKKVEKFESYTSQNTNMLDIDQLIKMLSQLDFIRKELET